MSADHAAKAKREELPPGLPTAVLLTLGVVVFSHVLPCYPRLAPWRGVLSGSDTGDFRPPRPFTRAYKGLKPCWKLDFESQCEDELLHKHLVPGLPCITVRWLSGTPVLPQF